jgi:hypothetical protein
VGRRFGNGVQELEEMDLIEEGREFGREAYFGISM